MSEPLVIIGKGMAATRFVEELTRGALGRYSIAIIGDEQRFAYNRVLLSSVLAGDVEASELPLKSWAWWNKAGVSLLPGTPATAVDVENRIVHLSNGAALRFSKLVFATGSNALRLPIPGAELPGVTVFRTLSDTTALSALGASKSKVTVIGGGLLGIEAAYGLAKRGAKVTLIHIMDRLMERQLDAEAAAMVKGALERQGIEVLLEAKTAAIAGSTRAEGVSLADGRLIQADAVVMAAGIQPNTDLAKAAGLETRRGIVVDSGLQSSTPGIYAIGECAEVDGACCGLVEPAYRQAETLARRLSDKESPAYEADIAATNLKVSGLPVFSAGDFLGSEGTSQILLRDRGAGLYKKLILRDGVLCGAVLAGDTSDSGWYLDLIRRGEPVSSLRPTLAFGRAFAGEGVAADPSFQKEAA